MRKIEKAAKEYSSDETGACCEYEVNAFKAGAEWMAKQNDAEIERLREQMKQIREAAGNYPAMVEEALNQRDELKHLLSEINEHVIPGEVDSIDALKSLVKERDQLKAEVERLKTLL